MLLRILRRGWLLAIFVTTAAAAQDVARIGRVVGFYEQRDGFSGTVTIARGGTILFSKGYGFADQASRIAPTADSRFNIGSLSKQFTAALILLLQQDGKLRVSDTLGSFLTEIPAPWKPITLRQLLSHTSGIPDYASRLTGDFMKSDHAPAELLDPVRALPLGSAPGSAYDYSNTNYLLLAMVVEQVAAQPFCRVMTDRILVPQGLTHTVCVDHHGPVPEYALGYVLRTDGPTQVPVYALSAYLGAASLVSTGEDLARWTWALHSGKVLKPDTLNEMLTPVLENYGYGLGIDEHKDHPRISHAGFVGGFNSLLDYLSDCQTTLVILSNQAVDGANGRSTGTYALENDLESLLLDSKAILISEGGELRVPNAVLDRYAGRYTTADASGGMSLTIAREGVHLTVTAEQDGKKQAAIPLRAETPSLFYVVGDEAELEFDPEHGEELALFILRNSTATLFKRATP